MPLIFPVPSLPKEHDNVLSHDLLDLTPTVYGIGNFAVDLDNF